MTSDGLVILRLSQEVKKAPQLKVWIIGSDSNAQLTAEQTKLAGKRVTVRVDAKWDATASGVNIGTG